MNEAPIPVTNAMTVDVEDYFQVSAFDDVIARADWDAHELRVEQNTRALMDLFASFDVSATFFVLGWVAERCPQLIADLHAAGHEIASHGYEHRLVSSLDPDSFRADLRRAADAIRAAAPVEVVGFRAPSFSITPDCLWAYDVLRDEGYTWSSSVFPVKHDRYGLPRFPRRPVQLLGHDGRTIWEVPMTTWRVLGRNFPVAGGGWMRVLPPRLMRHAIRRANDEGTAAIVYLHPWEIDPDQPRIEGVGRGTRFRHYVNLEKTGSRVRGLLESFPFGTVADILTQQAQGGSSIEPIAPGALARIAAS